MSNTDKLREIAEKYKNGGYRIVNDYAGNKTMQRYDNKDELLSDLTALISEHYVSKEAYNILKEHYQSALAAKDIERDYIDKYYYPKEFVEWKDTKELRYSSLHNRYYSDTDNGMREFTLDELFNYWRENEQ